MASSTIDTAIANAVTALTSTDFGASNVESGDSLLFSPRRWRQ